MADKTKYLAYKKIKYYPQDPRIGKEFIAPVGSWQGLLVSMGAEVNFSISNSTPHEYGGTIHAIFKSGGMVPTKFVVGDDGGFYKLKEIQIQNGGVTNLLIHLYQAFKRLSLPHVEVVI